jgi:hypothetical protein
VNITELCYNLFIFIAIGERRLEMDGSSTCQQEAYAHWRS